MMAYPYNDWREKRKVVTNPRLQIKVLNAYILSKQELERAGFQKTKVSDARDELVYYKGEPHRVSVWLDGEGKEVSTVERVVVFYS